MTTERETKGNIFTSDTYTVKIETLSNIRGRNGRSKGQRKVASNRPGPKLNKRIVVNSSSNMALSLHYQTTIASTIAADDVYRLEKNDVLCDVWDISLSPVLSCTQCK